MIGKKDTTDPQRDELLEEISSLRAAIAGLRKERDAESKGLRLVDEITRLKREISDLEVNKSKITEQHAREKREVEHMVGLQKKRADFEQESGKREAVLSVREENLKADKNRLKEQVEFLQTRFEAEVGYLKDLMGQVLDRLPNIRVDADALPAPRPRPRATK